MILTLWQKLMVAGAALVLALLLGFGAGWTVEKWHLGSAQADATKAQLSGMQKDYADSVKIAQAAADKLAAQNRTNDQNMADLMTKLGEQDDAFAKIRTDIAHIHVGTCRFDPAAYQLQIRAYEAAFGAASGAAPAPGEAARGHAADGAAQPAR